MSNLAYNAVTPDVFDDSYSRRDRSHAISYISNLQPVYSFISYYKSRFLAAALDGKLESLNKLKQTDYEHYIQSLHNYREVIVWCVVVIDKHKRYVLKGYKNCEDLAGPFIDAANQMFEVTYDPPKRYFVLVDAHPLLEGVRMLPRWSANGWVDMDGHRLKYANGWRRLFSYASQNNMKWGLLHNTRAIRKDSLARRLAKQHCSDLIHESSKGEPQHAL